MPGKRKPRPKLCGCGCGAKGLPKPTLLKAAAAELEVDEKTLREYAAAGCPHWKGKGRGRAGAWTFDLAEVVAWLEETGRTGQQGRPPSGLGPVQTDADGRQKVRDPERDRVRRATEDAHLRIKRAEASRKERENRQAEGDVVELALVLELWARQIQMAKRRLHALPGKLAGQIVERSYDEVYAILERELQEVLEGFAADLREELAT